MKDWRVLRSSVGSSLRCTDRTGQQKTDFIITRQQRIHTYVSRIHTYFHSFSVPSSIENNPHIVTLTYLLAVGVSKISMLAFSPLFFRGLQTISRSSTCTKAQGLSVFVASLSVVSFFSSAKSLFKRSSFLSFSLSQLLSRVEQESLFCGWIR